MTQEKLNGRPILEGKVVLITGASRGIGATAARCFAAKGACVALVARTKEAIESIASEIKASGSQALAIPADVGDAEAVERAVKKTVEEFGRLDLAFNNASEGHVSLPLADMMVKDFDRSIQVNLRGVFLSMKYEIPAMLAGGGGAIVNMTSTAGLFGVHGLGDYVAAKHGVIGLTKTAALDYAARNVRVNAIAAGPIFNERIAALSDEGRQPIINAVPLRRIGLPEDVSAAAIWLCSDEASFITGVVLSVDGGQMAGPH